MRKPDTIHEITGSDPEKKRKCSYFILTTFNRNLFRKGSMASFSIVITLKRNLIGEGFFLRFARGHFRTRFLICLGNLTVESTKQSRIFSPKRPIALHECATCSGLSSNYNVI